MKLGSIKLEWIALAGALIYILLLQECNLGQRLGLGGKAPTNDTLSHTIDTITITRIDTIQLPPVINYVTLEIPIPVYIHDTIWKGDSAVVRKLTEYKTDITDSLVEGRIISRVDGVLVSQILEYSPLFPKYIIRIDTVMITESTVIDKKRFFLYVGGELGGSASQFNLSPIIGVGTKKGYMYGYRYGLVDNTHNISISKKFSFNLKR